jgi:hypothetical protein
MAPSRSVEVLRQTYPDFAARFPVRTSCQPPAPIPVPLAAFVAALPDGDATLRSELRSLVRHGLLRLSDDRTRWQISHVLADGHTRERRLMSQQRVDDASSAAVAEGQPDHHGRRAEQSRQVVEADLPPVVLGDEHEALRLCTGPDAAVVRAAQPFENDLARTGVATCRPGSARCERFSSSSSFTAESAGRQLNQAACNQVVCRSRSAA